MQQFTVPQFIDVEDKIIGPLTTRQFLIMLSGFILIGVCYKLFDFSAFLAVGITIFAISGIFAFFKVNGMPFHFFILNFFQTMRRPKLRGWSNAAGKISARFEIAKGEIIQKPMQKPAKVYTTSRLTELSLIVDTRGVYKGELRSEPVSGG